MRSTCCDEWLPRDSVWIASFGIMRSPLCSSSMDFPVRDRQLKHPGEGDGP